MSNHTPINMLDEIDDQFPNFNGSTVQRFNGFIPHFLLWDHRFAIYNDLFIKNNTTVWILAHLIRLHMPGVK